jgi:hypothetical protein
MGRGDQVDIMTSLPLKGHHHVCQSFTRHFFSVCALADIIVLAELAGKIAVGYEDCPGPVTSHQRWLFAKMRTVRGNYREESGTAISSFILEPVNPAFSGAYRAGLKECIRPFDPFCQFT